jgi:hypothetical protein
MNEKNLKLNLGCGRNHLSGWVNVDNNDRVSPDVICDLNSFPYPFPDSCAKEIFMEHVLEHLSDPLAVMAEIYRLAQDDAIVTIKSPHFSCNWLHPSHKSAISTKLFDFLNKDNEEFYGNTDFIVKSVSLFWMRNTEKGKRSFLPIRVLNSVINYLAKLNPALTERIWCYWVGGFEEIVFSVLVRKK